MNGQNGRNSGNDQINLGQIIGSDHRYALTINNEAPEDASARRSNEMAEAVLKRKNVLHPVLFCTFCCWHDFYGLYVCFRHGNRRR
ncbi:MAG: hypothetical protein HS120_06925 [Burkholderiales bacterium]|nr:hypothetical protein [Burkholderiales bacterium]